MIKSLLSAFLLVFPGIILGQSIQEKFENQLKNFVDTINADGNDYFNNIYIIAAKVIVEESVEYYSFTPIYNKYELDEIKPKQIIFLPDSTIIVTSVDHIDSETMLASFPIFLLDSTHLSMIIKRLVSKKGKWVHHLSPALLLKVNKSKFSSTYYELIDEMDMRYSPFNKSLNDIIIERIEKD